MSKREKIFLFAAIFIFFGVAEAELRKIVSIGSNELNYLFLSVGNAVLDGDRNIYVSDSKGSFLRKYDAQGRFIKEVGKYGQGPGDFSNALAGLYIDNQLHLLDSGNNRIAVLDHDLNFKNYVKIKHRATGLVKIDDLYYMLATRRELGFTEIVAYNKQGEFQKAFFDQYPAFLGKKADTREKFIVNMMYSNIVFTVNRESNEIIVGHSYPGKEIEIFVYSKEGKFVRSLKVDHPIAYDFPDFLLKWPPEYPGRSELILIWSIHCLDANSVLLEYWVLKYRNNKAEEQKLNLLIIDLVTGRMVHREMVDSEMRILAARDRLILASREDGDIIKVILYELVY